MWDENERSTGALGKGRVTEERCCIENNTEVYCRLRNIYRIKTQGERKYPRLQTLVPSDSHYHVLFSSQNTLARLTKPLGHTSIHSPTPRLSHVLLLHTKGLVILPVVTSRESSATGRENHQTIRHVATT